MMVLDASVCISALIEGDPRHADSRPWLEQQTLAGTKFLAPTLLIVEISGVIARRTGRTDAGHRSAARLHQTIELELLPLDHRRMEAAAHLAADLRLRGADATYVAIAHEFGVPLVTWDREQLSRASQIITAFTPTSPRQNDHVE